MIVGGILFTTFGAFYYWFPKATGRMLSERLGRLHFWLFVIGFHLTFDFMHVQVCSACRGDLHLKPTAAGAPGI